jgi:uncharacterized protein YkwD
MYRRTIITAATLLALLIVAIGHAQPASPTAGAGITVYAPLIRQSPPPIQTAEQQAMAQQVLDLVNSERARANPACPALTHNAALTKAAQDHSRDMAVANFFAHTSLNGLSPGSRARSAGYSGQIGENIAVGYPTASQVMQGWMTSQMGHRENILNCNYREIGIGFYYQSDDQRNVVIGTNAQGQPIYGGPYYTYWTQDFGQP